MVKRLNKNPSVATTTKGQKLVKLASKTNASHTRGKIDKCKKNEGDWDGEPVHICYKAKSPIVARFRRYRGREFLDIRKYLDDALTRPTTKGITIPSSELAQFIQALLLVKLPKQ